MKRLILLLASPLLLAAAQPEYLPLRTGNQWIYRAPRGQTFTIEVTGTRDAGGQTYYAVNYGTRGLVLLRAADSGALMIYDSDTGKESVWVDFSAADGQSFTTAVDSCTASGRIRTHAATLDVPVGHYENLLEVDYSTRCADAGLTSEYYLPYVGLLQHTETSIAGPVVYDLVYARTNYGLTSISAPEQSFQAALDRLTYPAGVIAAVRMTLRSTLSDPLTVVFATGQQYDVMVRDEQGTVVYQWSLGKLFAQFVTTLKLTGEKSWLVPFAAPSTPGNYTVDVSLACRPAFHAQLPLVVTK